jgi:hypothetical protein
VITNERDDADVWYAIACGLLLVAAAAIRFRALGATLFEDEVWVAELVRRGGLHPHSYNAPPLFYWIERAWTALRGTSNEALREPAAIFGVAVCVVPLFAPVSRLSRFTCALLLAFSSPLLFYSGRLKQYTIEAFAAAVLVVLFLRMRESRSRMNVLAFFSFSAAAVMSLHSPVFLLAAMALLSIRTPRVLGGFAVIFALFAVAYIGWFKPGAETIRLHGDMNLLFSVTGRWVSSPSNFLRNTLHWAGQSLNLVRFWWLAVVILVLTRLARERKTTLLLLAALPPLEIAAASAIHVYPYGEVRLMIFCLPAFYLLIADALGSAARRVPLLLLLTAPFVIAGVANDSYNATYMHIDDLRPMFEMIVRSHAPGEAIYANPSYAEPLRYEYPALAAFIRPAKETAAVQPGWYIQQRRSFDAAGTTIMMRIGDVIAARRGP